MSKPQRRPTPAPAVAATLPLRAEEALRAGKFKEAIDLFKQLVRQEPRPDWKAGLADAYHGRARTLADKQMFKEAAMVLENTRAADSTVRDPHLYVTCLIRDGQQPKAAAHLLTCIAGEALPADLEDLAAALLVAVPLLPVPARTSPAVARWRDLATASRDALAAWSGGAPTAEIDRHLDRISLRSAFRPVRLLLKTLITAPPDAERARLVLGAIGPSSPFFPLCEAALASLRLGPGCDADSWKRLSPAQQAFVAETGGLSADAVQSLSRLSSAAAGGPGALFTTLLKQTDLPQAERRSACLNLLPQIPDRLAQFERSFGALAKFDRQRVQALAAEARADWPAAERAWQAVVEAFEGDPHDPQVRQSEGVIFRHLADLAAVHRGALRADGFRDPVTHYLECAWNADPDHIPTLVVLVGKLREDETDTGWHEVVDAALKRFPEDSQVLALAIDAAVARKAYKKAAGFARRLLRINSINVGVRRQMIELQVAHARRQMAAKRADLATRELADAAEWERPEAPSALLRIARGLVGLRTTTRAQAEAWLREGVELAGGGVAGWFRAVIEVELMKSRGSDTGWLREELAKARTAPPTKEAVTSVIAALGRPEAVEGERRLANVLAGMTAWLGQGAALAWSPAEFQGLADTLVRYEMFDLIGDYARVGRGRDPGNPDWRFHEIFARVKGHSERMTIAETDEIENMADAASQRHDFHAARRFERFLEGNQRRFAGSLAPDDLDEFDDEDFAELCSALVRGLPKQRIAEIRALVNQFGEAGAVEKMVAESRSDPTGAAVPLPMLQQMFRAMVARAMGRATPGGRS